MIKAVFFDLYQTLVHYRPSQEELEAKALARLGIKTTAEALSRPILAANEFISKEIAVSPLSQRTQGEVAALYADYQRVVLREAGLKAYDKTVIQLLAMMQQARMDIVLYDDALPVLTDLKNRGLITGLISNVEKNMTDTISRLGIASQLDVIVTSQDAGAAKPQPEIFVYTLRQAGVSAAESIYVGDQYQVDMTGAANAGLKGVLLDRTGYYRDTLDCPVIRGLKELIDYIV